MSTIREPANHCPVSHSRISDQGTSAQQHHHHSCLHPRVSPPQEDPHIPEKVSRKVSFSDVVVTSSRIEKPESDAATPSRFYEQVTVEERRSSSPVNEVGHNIVVQPIDVKEDDLTRDTALASSTLPVFEVKLGMLKQGTVYYVEFEVPHELSKSSAELLRFIDETPGHVSAPVNVGAQVELLSCTPNQSGPGHHLLLKLATTKQHRVNEFFTLRLVDNPTEAVHLVLHGLSLGRGQGTPFLRLGIHRIGENPDFEDSDEFTEWPGFVQPSIEELENEESQDPMDATQGDQPDASETTAGT